MAAEGQRKRKAVGNSHDRFGNGGQAGTERRGMYQTPTPSDHQELRPASSQHRCYQLDGKSFSTNADDSSEGRKSIDSEPEPGTTNHGGSGSFEDFHVTGSPFGRFCGRMGKQTHTVVTVLLVQALAVDSSRACGKKTSTPFWRRLTAAPSQPASAVL